MNNDKMELSPEQREELLSSLKVRFEKNMNRHKGFEWDKVQAKLEANRGLCSNGTKTAMGNTIYTIDVLINGSV
jgi:hypothetical protein